MSEDKTSENIVEFYEQFYPGLRRAEQDISLLGDPKLKHLAGLNDYERKDFLKIFKVANERIYDDKNKKPGLAYAIYGYESQDYKSYVARALAKSLEVDFREVSVAEQFSASQKIKGSVAIGNFLLKNIPENHTNGSVLFMRDLEKTKAEGFEEQSRQWASAISKITKSHKNVVILGEAEEKGNLPLSLREFDVFGDVEILTLYSPNKNARNDLISRVIARLIVNDSLSLDQRDYEFIGGLENINVAELTKKSKWMTRQEIIDALTKAVIVANTDKSSRTVVGTAAIKQSMSLIKNSV